MDTLLFVAGFALLLGALLGGFVLWKSRTRGLSSTDKRQLQQHWKHVEAAQTPEAQVLEADKVIDQLLGALGYSGSMGEKLKKAGPRIRNLDALWRAHKLRNRLAHEPGATAQPQEARQALKAFRATLSQFL